MHALETEDTEGLVSGTKRADEEAAKLVKVLQAALAGTSLLAVVLLAVCVGISARGRAPPPAPCLIVPPSPPPAPPPPHSTAPSSAPTRRLVILISFDGFRHDYLARPEIRAPALRALMAGGTVAERLQPVFPSKTFPNHYSIATGLYPGSHGVVANGFTYHNATFSMRSKELGWWLGEPIWATAALQGRKAGTVFWPGSETQRPGWPCSPPSCLPYNGSMPNAERIDRGLAMVAKGAELLTLYFSDTDDAGHRWGQDAPDVTAAVERLDAAVAHLVAGLRARKLLAQAHIIVVGDHGMASLCANKHLYVDDLISASMPGGAPNPLAAGGVTVAGLTLGAELGPFAGFWANRREPGGWRGSAQALAAGLNATAAAAGHVDILQAWAKEDLPARLGGYGTSLASDRVWDVVALIPSGWMLTTKQWDEAGGCGGGCGGTHGFDNAFESMGTVFVGNGPRFAPGVVLPGWTPNVELYNVMADLLEVTPAPNNGTAGFAGRVLLPRSR